MITRLRDDNLKKSLREDGLKSFYLLAGNDAYLISRCCALLKGTADEVETLDFCEAGEEETEQQLSSYSFTEKLLIIDNFRASEYAGARKALYEEFLPELPSTLRVAVKAYSEGPSFKLSKAAESIASLCPDSAVVICEKKKDRELVRYVCAMAKSAGAELGYAAAEELIRLRGDDLFLLSGEVKKLAAASGYGEIGERLVRDMCPRTTEDSVFDFIRAAERGNTKQAVSLFYDIMEQEQSPNAVIAAISSSYVNMARVAAAREAKVPREQVESDFGYKKGDRALGVAFDKGGRFSRELLDQVVELLYGLNAALTSSSEDKQILMERGMVRLTELMRGRR